MKIKTPLYSSQSGIFTLKDIQQSATLFIERVYGQCKSVRTEVYIQVVKNVKVFVPTAFSPNGDGQNDLLKLTACGLPSIEYFNVYNRWGTLVFHSKDMSAGWDGRFDGKKQPIGTYVWELKAKSINNEEIEQHGTITLVR